MSSNNENNIEIITAELEPDPEFRAELDYESSGYASGQETDTISLVSAAKKYIFENGRRYHGYKEGKYLVPNDEAEQDRMDLMHHCFLLSLRGELIAAPVGKDWNPQRILDVGTGTGIWAIDMADRYPSAEVIGVDLSAIQPDWVPPNVKFEVDDVEDTWTYQSESFDFIHIRDLAGFIPDWPKLYRQAFKALKPGGWIEFKGPLGPFISDDGSLPTDSPLAKWNEFCEEASAKCGRSLKSTTPAISKSLTDLGCIDIEEKIVKFPIGPWPKNKNDKVLGVYYRQHLLDGAEGFALAPFTRVLGWRKEKVDDFLLGVYADLKNPNFHAYVKYYYTYGRKPYA